MDFQSRMSSSRRAHFGGWLGALPRLAEHDLYVHLALAAINSHGHGISCAMLVHGVDKVLLIADRVTVDGDNKIAADHDGGGAQVRALTAAVQARAVRGAARSRPHN